MGTLLGAPLPTAPKRAPEHHWSPARGTCQAERGTWATWLTLILKTSLREGKPGPPDAAQGPITRKQHHELTNQHLCPSLLKPFNSFPLLGRKLEPSGSPKPDMVSCLSPTAFSPSPGPLPPLLSVVGPCLLSILHPTSRPSHVPFHAAPIHALGFVLNVNSPKRPSLTLPFSLARDGQACCHSSSAFYPPTYTHPVGQDGRLSTTHPPPTAHSPSGCSVPSPVPCTLHGSC